MGNDFFQAVRELEGDKLEFEAHGLPCVIVRVRGLGHLCGYVGVPEGHPFNGLDYSDEALYGVEVHGGLTYSRANNPLNTGEDGFWWFGFDCAHLGDFCPGASFNSPTDDYRDMDYVRAECERLAEQLRGESS